MVKRLIFLVLIITACQSQGNLTFLGDLSNDLKEVSAVEMMIGSDDTWVIEDSGNQNKVYVLDSIGNTVRSILVENSKNRDWEDLTFDVSGNLYIGDFGNNSKKHKTYKIYKINGNDLDQNKVVAEKIEFKLSKEVKAKDFEAFFVKNNYFYLFSKENKKVAVYKVPNIIGKHEAQVLNQNSLEGKGNKITSADVSDDGKTVVLLNHDKLWKLTNFKGDDFFSGTIERLDFNHNSQKEGVCFKSDSTVLITDERSGMTGGNLYELSLLKTKKESKKKNKP